ncbi:transcriptional repressor AgaR [Roseateles sp. BYS180W]|uniref:Transcriptional repressor AgaR n=1 Tax=Roseateles rivi TaxID=3299028 RepID=A0ABW7FV06_9BURK
MSSIQERRESLLKFLSARGDSRVSDLVKRLGVSAVTVRHDLNFFEEQGLVTRKHGWVTLNPLDSIEDIREKSHLNPSLKERIGARAAQMVKPGDNILIDSGTTTHRLAGHLKNAQNLTVMSNGLNIVNELAQAPGVQIISTGGLLRSPSLTFQGAQAYASLDAYSFDTLFLGVDGFDLDFGITTHSVLEADMNRKMVERSRRTVVLADSSKFGRMSLHRVVGLERVHVVVTDAGVPEAYRLGLLHQGITLIVVD